MGRSIWIAQPNKNITKELMISVRSQYKNHENLSCRDLWLSLTLKREKPCTAGKQSFALQYFYFFGSCGVNGIFLNPYLIWIIRGISLSFSKLLFCYIGDLIDLFFRTILLASVRCHLLDFSIPSSCTSYLTWVNLLLFLEIYIRSSFSWKKNCRTVWTYQACLNIFLPCVWFRKYHLVHLKYLNASWPWVNTGCD